MRGRTDAMWAVRGDTVTDNDHRILASRDVPEDRCARGQSRRLCHELRGADGCQPGENGGQHERESGGSHDDPRSRDRAGVVRDSSIRRPGSAATEKPARVCRSRNASRPRLRRFGVRPRGREIPRSPRRRLMAILYAGNPAAQPCGTRRCEQAALREPGAACASDRGMKE